MRRLSTERLRNFPKASQLGRDRTETGTSTLSNYTALVHVTSMGPQVTSLDAVLPALSSFLPSGSPYGPCENLSCPLGGFQPQREGVLELSAMRELFCVCAIQTLAVSSMWPVST